MSYDHDRELDAPLARIDALCDDYEARIEKAREEAMDWLSSKHTFALFLKEEPRYLSTLMIQMKVIAIDRLDEEGAGSDESVRLGLIDDVRTKMGGWFADHVANERD